MNGDDLLDFIVKSSQFYSFPHEKLEGWVLFSKILLNFIIFERNVCVDFSVEVFHMKIY